MEELTAQVEKLCLANRINRVLAVMGAVFCVVAVLLFVRGQVLCAGAMTAVCLAVFLMARQSNRQYSRSATSANLRYGLARELEGFSYQPAGGMTEEEFRNWEILPIAEGRQQLLCRNFFSGREDNRTLTGVEVAFHYRTESGGTAGYRFLSGTMLTATGLRRAETDGWLLLSREQTENLEVQQFLSERGYRPAPESPAGLRLYSPTGVAAPEELLARLSQLPKTVTALRLTDSGAAAYLDGRFYTGVRYPAARPTEQRLLENTLPERDEIWELFRWWLSAGETAAA